MVKGQAVDAKKDTITAISTPPGRGGVGIVRVSGQKALELSSGFFIRKEKKIPKGEIDSHHAYHGKIIDMEGNLLDEGILLYMKSPNSYTGEDVVEIQTHSSPVILEELVRMIVTKGARVAEPGEFTKRAFLNGRLDLVQAEAVSELIGSRSILESRLAARRVSGELSSYINDMKGKVIAILAAFEAEIDFPEDVPGSARDEKFVRIEEIETGLKRLSESFEKNRIASKGIEITISGEVNAGKSTLFNALLKRNRAITSPAPGTTRDYISEELDIGGVTVRLYDTAGLNGNRIDPVEKEGVLRTKEILERADIVLLVIDRSRADALAGIGALENIKSGQVIAVLNKSDLGREIEPGFLRDVESVEISALKGTGIEKLEKKIVESFKGPLGDLTDAIMISSMRQKEKIDSALQSLERAKEGIKNNLSPEFITLDLRQLYERLCSFAGEEGTDTEKEVLDKIFSSFCIGK